MRFSDLVPMKPKTLKKTRFQHCCLVFSYMAQYGHYSVVVFKTPKRHVSENIISIGDIVAFAGISTFWYLTTPKTRKTTFFANVEIICPYRAHCMRFRDLVPMRLKTLKKTRF